MKVPSPGCLASILCLVACAAHGSPRYLVTDRPIDIGAGPGICLAVEPTDPHGVWWWQPAGGDCERRSTGPGVFQAGDAVVTPQAGGDLSVAFVMQMHGNPPTFRVALVLADNRLRRVDGRGETSVHARADLKIPGMGID